MIPPGPVKFPPFTTTSSEVASRLLRGEMDSLGELASINGHAYYHVEAVGPGRIRARLYFMPAPRRLGLERVDRLLAEEWRAVADRLTELVSRMPPDSYQESGGVLVYEWLLVSPGMADVARLVGGLRRVAGLEPYIDVRVDPERDTFYTGDSSVALEIEAILYGGLFLFESLEDLADRDSKTSLLYACLRNNCLAGPVSVSSLARSLGEGETRSGGARYKTSVWRILMWLESVGAARKIGREYYVYLRHEFAVQYMMVTLPSTLGFELGDPDSAACIPLPYLEGVEHKHWAIYPGPYRACEEISETMRALEEEFRGKKREQKAGNDETV